MLLRRRLAHRVISEWPKPADLRREIIYSLSTLAIFSAVGVLIVGMLFCGTAVVYGDPAQYGWAWMVLSLPLIIFMHDSYFYWTHRLLHMKWAYKRFHLLHHRSSQPSPWTAYSFHPVEAIIHAIYVPLILCLFPVNVGVLMIFSLHQVFRNMHFHLSIETMPKGFARHWLWGRFTTSTHHHLHHESPATGNYGLWFTWWDRFCSTEQTNYLQRFDSVTQTKNTAT